MNATAVRRGLGGYLVVESVCHDGLTIVLGIIALRHGSLAIGLVAVLWATIEVTAKITAAILLNRHPGAKRSRRPLPMPHAARRWPSHVRKLGPR